MPEVCRRRSWTVIGLASGTRSSLPLFSTPTFCSENSGMYLAIGSFSRKWPSSSSIMMPTETIGFVIEAMRKMVLCAIGPEAAGFCLPSASNQPIWPRRATIAVTPGMVPLSISRLKASDMRCNRTDESPIDSGLACGSGGVCGAAVCLAAVCAVTVSRGCFVLAGEGEIWRRTYGLNRAFAARQPPVCRRAVRSLASKPQRPDQAPLTASPLQSGHWLCLKRPRIGGEVWSS
jgi:hypothetical protein